MSTPITRSEQFIWHPDVNNGEPILTYQNPGEQLVELKGADALANATTSSVAKAWRKANPMDTLKHTYKKDNDNFAYRLGYSLRNDQPKTAIGEMFDNSAIGPKSQALIGALAGGGLGALGGYLSDATMDTNLGMLVPSLVGAGLLGGVGYLRGSAKEEQEKSAAMYRNPRNFILEKLQADTSATGTEKAMLAVAVQKMDEDDAENLKKDLRMDGVINNAARIIGEHINGRKWQNKLHKQISNKLTELLMMQQPSEEQVMGCALGEFLAKSASGATYAQISAASHTTAAIGRSVETQAMICGAANEFVKMAGAQETPLTQVYANIAKNPLAYGREALDDISSAVAFRMGQASRMNKSASWLYGALSDIAKLGVKTTTVASVGLGGALGALAWKLNRDANQVSAEAEAKREQAKFYKEMAKDLNKQMKQKARRDAEEERKARKSAKDAAGEVLQEQTDAPILL